jgi:Tfp pilus assembly protein PilF
MVSTPPLLSPILWTTIATGRYPEDHGVLDFMVDTPAGDQTPVSAAERRVPALWNLFSAAGRRVAVVGWWATWPAEEVRGTIVSDRVAPQLRPDAPRLDDRAISPATQASRLAAAIVSPAALSLDQMRAYLPLSPSEFDTALSAGRQPGPGLYKNKIAHLAAVVAGTRSYSAIAVRLASDTSPDLLAVYLEGIDTVSHLFVRDSSRGPAAIAAAYRDADDLLGRLATAVPPDTWIVVCSDHGFYSPAAAIAEDPSDLAGAASAWHRPYGIVAAIEAGVLTGRQQSLPVSIGRVTPLDVAPTVLHAAGLPVGDRMPGRVIEGLLPPDVRGRPVAKASFADVARTIPGTSSPADADLKARLQALGYVDARSTSLARQNLGEILYRRGRLAAAERELRAVVEKQPSNVTALLWLAKTCRDQGRSREALRLYERAAAGTGGRGEALVEAAEVATSAGSLEEGRRIVDHASNAPSTAVSAHVARAILMRASGDDRGAERELRGALARDPLSFEALSRLLDLLAATRRVRVALPLFQSAAKRAPASPRHLALLGAAYLGSADARSAEAPLQRALELAPDGSALRLDLARAQISQRKLEAAALTLSSADPSRERSLLLGALSSLQEKWADAATHYQAALEGGSPQPDVLNGLGWAKLKLGKKGEAADLFHRSLALDRNQPEIDRLVTQLAPRPAASPR